MELRGSKGSSVTLLLTCLGFANTIVLGCSALLLSQCCSTSYHGSRSAGGSASRDGATTMGQWEWWRCGCILAKLLSLHCELLQSQSNTAN